MSYTNKCFRCCLVHFPFMYVVSVSVCVSPVQRSVEGKSPKTPDRFSRPTILTTTGPTKCVCGRLQLLRATMSA